MKYRDMERPLQEGVNAHVHGIMALSAAKRVMVILADSDDDMIIEISRTLNETFDLDVFNAKTHRLVAIMAADREPGDAAKAVEDVVTGNADAARVFDAVAEAFGRRKDGDHIDMNITVNNDRVLIEHYQPPREGETVLGTLKTFTPGQMVSAVATDIEARPIAKYAIDQQVYERVGVGYRRVVVTGIFHYRNSATSYQVEDIEPTGEHRQRVWEENALFEDVPDA